jgi:isocitrate lyase
MGTTNLVVARTDSEAATLITTNIDPRDHAFILGSTNPDLLPLNDIMLAGELARKSGAELQNLEDEWTKQANLQLYPDTLCDALAKQGLSASKIKEFRDKLTSSHASNSASLQIAKSYGLKQAPYWSWDTPRTREGYYRYQGGTQCAINRAIAFAPHADLLWMETKSPIYAQAREFANGVHKERPGQWLAYNLSPSFNWDAAGLGEKEMKEYVWELGKLGFIFQFITVGSSRHVRVESVADLLACGSTFERLHQRQIRQSIR